MTRFTRIGKSPEEHARELRGKIAVGLDKGMKAVEADAKMLVGVDTGRLRSSITSRVEENGGTLTGIAGSNVEYAFFHSLQNPYLEGALDSNLQFIIQSIKGSVG